MYRVRVLGRGVVSPFVHKNGKQRIKCGHCCPGMRSSQGQRLMQRFVHSVLSSVQTQHHCILAYWSSGVANKQGMVKFECLLTLYFVILP